MNAALAAFRRKHSAQKEQIARPHRLHIGAERLGRRRERDAKLLQPLLGAGRVSRVIHGAFLLYSYIVRTTRNCALPLSMRA